VIQCLFDPAKPEQELYDTLAEQQAVALSVNSSQLRRFFGEIKDLYRRYNALTAQSADDGARADVYRRDIEPLFKMIRSKVSYATRAGGQSKLDVAFADFLSQGIAKVQSHDQFRKYVMHLEAVVGFMYGKGKVSR
jgi:CRISPR type III-A-associated protein Csm2